MKICVPIVGETNKQILNDIEKLLDLDFDLIELRIDYYKHVENIEKVIDLLEEIKAINLKPLIFTFRTKNEGGMHDISEEMYFNLNKSIIKSELVNLVDIELYHSEDEIKKLISLAHENNIKVVLSNHDFHKTPCKNEIINRLVKMQNLNADITKIAVMPVCEEDVLTLMEASLEMKKEKADRPFIALSMGTMGIITRLAVSLLGSCITFASLDDSSAPGQINVKYAREIINILK